MHNNQTLNSPSACARLNMHQQLRARALIGLICLTSLSLFGGCADQADWPEGAQVATSKSNDVVQVGDMCSAGCVWSSYAVTSGLQPAERLCNGQKCACVVNGDAAMSCAADAPKTDDFEEQSAGSSCGSGPRGRSSSCTSSTLCDSFEGASPGSGTRLPSR